MISERLPHRLRTIIRILDGRSSTADNNTRITTARRYTQQLLDEIEDEQRLDQPTEGPTQSRTRSRYP